MIVRNDIRINCGTAPIVQVSFQSVIICHVEFVVEKNTFELEV